MVNRVDAKLAKWTELYGQLKEARTRLKEALQQPGPEPVALKAEVDRLQRACGEALDELQAEFARMKAGDSGSDSR